MIDTEKIEVSLAILTDDAEAQALYRKMKAEHRAEELKAKAFLAATGPIEERKAKAILDPDYQGALANLAAASGKHRKTQNDRDGAKYIIEVWEQEGHNARAAEKLR